MDLDQDFVIAQVVANQKTALLQVAVAVAAIYDHFIALPQEVDLVWRRPRSFMSTLYFMHRYLGDAVLITVAYHKSFRYAYLSAGFQLTPKNIVSASTSPSLQVCEQTYQFQAWSMWAFTWAAQVFMQMRVYALYQKSRTILILLFACYMIQIITSGLILDLHVGPTSSLIVMNLRIPGVRSCMASGVTSSFSAFYISTVCFELLLFVLAASVFVKHSLEMKRMLGYWRMNSLMTILIKQSVLYFLANLATIATFVGIWMSIPAMDAAVATPCPIFVAVITGPRLFLSFRHHHEVMQHREVDEGVEIELESIQWPQCQQFCLGGATGLHTQYGDWPSLKPLCAAWFIGKTTTNAFTCNRKAAD